MINSTQPGLMGSSREQVRQALKRSMEELGHLIPRVSFVWSLGLEKMSARKSKVSTYCLNSAFHFLSGKSFIEM